MLKRTNRYQHQLLLRRSYKPNRLLVQFRPSPKEVLVFRPSRAGPKLKIGAVME